MLSQKIAPRRSARLTSKSIDGVLMAAADSGRVDDTGLAPGKKFVKRLEETVNEGMEVFVRYCPRPIMAMIGMILFWPTLWWNDLLKSKGKGKPGEPPRNWYDRVQPRIICGALPRAHLVPKLKEEGVTHVVNMVAEYGGPVKDYQTAGIVQERFPVIGTKEFFFLQLRQQLCVHVAIAYKSMTLLWARLSVKQPKCV